MREPQSCHHASGKFQCHGSSPSVRKGHRTQGIATARELTVGGDLSLEVADVLGQVIHQPGNRILSGTGPEPVQASLDPAGEPAGFLKPLGDLVGPAPGRAADGGDCGTGTGAELPASSWARPCGFRRARRDQGEG